VIGDGKRGQPEITEYFGAGAQRKNFPDIPPGQVETIDVEEFLGDGQESDGTRFDE